MKDKYDQPYFREVGKGFIVSQIEGIVGRILTQTYMDQHKKTYVKIRGEYIPLTKEHNFLAA
ncbi:MAG: hypothetical protein KJ630_07755 [Proteobacteria bacterium]|nr:hypothetical protein [Pseudomonadota bacterium]